MTQPACRFCGAPLSISLVDLGQQPLANSYLREEDLGTPEPRYPLHARVCERCWLVQVDDAVPPGEIFSDYAYFSSYSDSWVEHARRFAAWAVAAYELGPHSFVVELASNDGYLLRHLRPAGIRVLGVEPAANVAKVAHDLGVETVTEFFGRHLAGEIAHERGAADLVVANNVLAHVPDLNDFVAGIRALLKPTGRVSIEVPHLLRLLERLAFDTIYHEHFSYFSVGTAVTVLAEHGLVVFDVEELPTHGGSVRLHASLEDAAEPTSRLSGLLEREEAAGLRSPEPYLRFAEGVGRCVEGFRAFLSDVDGTVAGYGAAAKGVTFLNTAGVTEADMVFVADRSAAKQGRYMPGSRVPIVGPERITSEQPASVIVLAWNLLEEVRTTVARLVRRPTRLVTCVPFVRSEKLAP